MNFPVKICASVAVVHTALDCVMWGWARALDSGVLGSCSAVICLALVVYTSP